MIIPAPQFHEEDTHSSDDLLKVDNTLRDEWIVQYGKCKPWICVKCGTKMFGRVKKCVYCNIRLGMITLRPSDYVEGE